MGRGLRRRHLPLPSPQRKAISVATALILQPDAPLQTRGVTLGTPKAADLSL